MILIHKFRAEGYWNRECERERENQGGRENRKTERYKTGEGKQGYTTEKLFARAYSVPQRLSSAGK